MPHIVNNSNYSVEAITDSQSINEPAFVFIFKSSDGKPSPIIPIDTFYGATQNSSIQYASDALPPKQNADITLSGYIQYSKPRQFSELRLSVRRLGSILLDKKIVCFGHREWHWQLGRWRISKPLSFDIMPLRYEYAFGGHNELFTFGKNPAGMGHYNCTDCYSGFALPYYELALPYQRIKRLKNCVDPAGFSPRPLHWLPHQTFSRAPADQQIKGCFEPGDIISMQGFSDTPDTIVLNNPWPVLHCQSLGTITTQCDSVHIHLNPLQVTQVWRVRVPLSAIQSFETFTASHEAAY